MMRELTAKDFERAVRNPHFDKLMIKVEVPVSKEDWATLSELAKINEVRPEIILQNCIAEFAEEVRESDD
jgi:hypothetical protein